MITSPARAGGHQHQQPGPGVTSLDLTLTDGALARNTHLDTVEEETILREVFTVSQSLEKTFLKVPTSTFPFKNVLRHDIGMFVRKNHY